MQNKEIFDLLIVGAGPTGMFAAYYAGMREIKTKVVESLSNLGGQINLMYPEKIIKDIGAIPEIKGKHLVSNLKEQMDRYPADISMNEKVLDIKKEEDYFFIQTDKNSYYSRTVLLTSGQGIFEPRKLALEYPLEYEKENLHYYVDSLEEYRDKKVTLLGGGDSAVDWALMLESIAGEVNLVHRRERFRAHEASVSQLRKSSVQIITPYLLDEIIGDGEKIEKVRLKKRREDKTILLDTDFLIVNYGFISKSRQLEHWGIENRANSALVNQKMETNLPGIFAAGDAANFDGKVKLIASGFGEIPTVINSIIHYLNIY